MDKNWVLGIWDGHDAGCALLRGDQIVFAINEERLSRRKLEIGFPKKSIEAALRFAHIKPEEIGAVAFTTADFAKTLTRWAPSLQEEYYQLRRKKKEPGSLNSLKKGIKYFLTEIPATAPTRAMSRMILKRELGKIGIHPKDLSCVEHHRAHAATAAFCSGFDEGLVITLDGIGDGLSGTICEFRGGKFKLLSSIDGRASLGIFFEHVTNLMNMRELEDEGKVMAMASMTYPIPDKDNALLDFFRVEGLVVKCKYSSSQLYKELGRVFWKTSSEQFAYMAQRTLEAKVLELVRNALKSTGLNKIAYAGGIASNVKLNLLIRELPGVEDLFIFPHMGDGGQGMGAAMWSNFEKSGVRDYKVADVLWGPEYAESDIQKAISKYPGLNVTRPDDSSDAAAELLSQGEAILWFQGRMEFGPRALGGRSILARADSPELKDRLNLRLKKRSWYQPYCPSMLESAAAEVLEGYDPDRANRFMTCAYRTRASQRQKIAGVIAPDGSCRPQILEDSAPGPYVRLLNAMKKKTGLGIVLNTSFNLHGEPMVCSPDDAMKTFAASDFQSLVLGPFVVRKA